MLYDPENERRQLFQLNKPSLEALSYALRHPETWPKDFYWNFTFCETCAMGLASALWHQTEASSFSQKKSVSDVARMFAMPYETVNDIFMGRGDWAPKKPLNFVDRVRGLKPLTNDDAITPEMVADQIDKYLAEGNK